MSDEKLDAIAQFERSDVFHEREVALLRFSDQLTRNGEVDGPVFEALRQHFSPRELVEITLSVCEANFVNRFNDGLEVPLEEIFQK